MGAIHYSIDKNLVDLFRKSLPLETFVETGTLEGDSVEAVRSDFKEVYSVESAETYHRRAVERFRGAANVQLLLGNSPDVLAELRPRLAAASVLYWLDAHWCVAGEATGGQHSQCPLLDELDAIGSLNEQSLVLIDDARLFLAPPPAPHEASQWPDFDSIVRKLLAASPVHRLMVLNDVIVFFPAACHTAIHEYARTASFDLLVEMSMSRRFRELEKQFHQAIADKELLAQETSRISADRTRLEKESARLDADNTRLEREASALQQALTTRSQEASALQQEASALRQEASALRQEASALRQEASALQQEASALQQEASRLQRTLSEIEKNFWYRATLALKAGLSRLRRG